MPEIGTDRFGRVARKTVLWVGDVGELRLNAAMALADEWGWELLSRKGLPWPLPSDIELGGAIIDHLPDSEVAIYLREQGCPTVRLGRFIHPEDSLLPAVLPDLEAQGRLSAEHFLERRFQNLAFVGFRVGGPDFMYEPLYSAFCSCAEDAGAKVYSHSFMQPGESKLKRQELWARRQHMLAVWLHRLPKPVGILTNSDGLGVEVCGASESEGIKIPGEVAVLGLGDTPLCRMTRLPLSSVDTAGQAQVRDAMLLLRRMMAGEEVAETPVMVAPAGISERRSTDVLSVSHPVAVRAIRYIWQHVREDPSVDDVAKALGVQRRSLERVFEEQVGMGIRAEMRRRRLELYCRELRASDETIAALSAKMGYRSLETMHRHFREVMGTTPYEYRRASRVS